MFQALCVCVYVWVWCPDVLACHSVFAFRLGHIPIVRRCVVILSGFLWCITEVADPIVRPTPEWNLRGFRRKIVSLNLLLFCGLIFCP